MAISMVRQPSETPNINNISDIIPFRYAYGGQNGYVKGKGRELEHEAVGNQFTIKSGRVVLDGVESDIGVDGENFQIDVISETRYYTISYVVNLGNNTTTLELQQGTSTYPTVERGFDLTENPEGTARLLLYRFTATSGIISNVEKVVQVIEYTGDALDGYDISKGTIERRFEALGFKRGSVELLYGYTATRNELKRQGNYVLGRLELNFQNTITNITYIIGNIPKEFCPANIEEGSAIGTFRVSTNVAYELSYTHTFKFRIVPTEENGEIIGKLTLVGSVEGGSNPGTGSYGAYAIAPVILNFGYEANPL